jgi:hypothetical protein
MELTKLILSQNVYRRPAATNEQPAHGYLPVGSTVEVSEVIFGKEIDGNCIWYHAGDGFFYWSGGVANVEFSVPSLLYETLSYEQQLILCLQAQHYYGPILRNQFPELLGIATNQKESDNQIQDSCSLILYVQQKLKTPTLNFPTSLPYCGFLIPTDVRPSLPVSLCNIGGFIGKPGENMGTSGFVGIDNSHSYLVTGYHVLCEDRLKAGVKSLLADDASYNNRRNITDSKGPLGLLTNGTMDAFNDSIKTKLTRSFKNITANGTILNGYIPRSELSDKAANRTKVVMSGAVTAVPLAGSIVNLNRDLDIPVINHSFFQLIEIDIPAKHGDSGAPVYTLDSNRLVGIVTATNFVNRTFVIPIEVILRRLELANVAS